jgi:arabinosyltransferase
MAPIRRQDHQPSRRYPVLIALAAGIAFGLIVAMFNTSRSPAGHQLQGAGASLQDEADALNQQMYELEKQLKEAKSERDSARRQLADQVQQQKDIEARLLQAEQTSNSIKGSEIGEENCPDRHTPWLPSSTRDKINPALGAFLEKVAINNEVLVAVSNANYAWPGGMLELWMKSVKRAGVKNAIVVALDDDTKTNVEKFGFPAFRLDMTIPDSQKKSGSNHAVSALKFRILKPFLELGYSVLLSDVDIVTLDNPFNYLIRDSDVESLSDGWTEETAYGYNDVADDPSMGWARYAHSMRIFVFNSGLFYLRNTNASLDLLDKAIYRVESEEAWDQAVWNECIFFPNSPKTKDPGVTRRVMDMEKFMNSKYLFKFLRHNEVRFQQVEPAMVHVNYHPDKFERMKAVWAHYVEGKKNALDVFPDGSE